MSVRVSVERAADGHFTTDRRTHGMDSTRQALSRQGIETPLAATQSPRVTTFKRGDARTGEAGRKGRAGRGRPRIIQSPEEMDRLVQAYVTKCRENGEPLTLGGMILHLGLSSRQSLDRYRRRPEFAFSVGRAKLLIEAEYEQRLHSNHPYGAILALRNMGWSDRRKRRGPLCRQM